jgi:cytochrome c oxidase subunit II
MSDLGADEDMRVSGMGMRRLLARSALALSLAASGTGVRAADLVGQPTPGAIDLQPAASPIKHMVIWFNNFIIMPVMFGIAIFVLILLLIVIVRFNKRANPTPKKFTHNTPLEIIWTIVPVLILAFVAIFSFRLLYAYHDTPKPDVTVKVTGYQWYWGYAYPDQKIPEYISNILPEDKAPLHLYRLATDNPLVVPVGKVVKVLVTGADVIHDWALPAFGLKTDAIPGRVNDTWFKAEKVGTYYGECSELCGANHAFMPIEVKVVSDAEFAAFVAQHHGTPTSAQVVTAAGPDSPKPTLVSASLPVSGAPASQPQ